MEPYQRRAEDPNPPHGERGKFRKITITLPPGSYERLIRESARRKIAGEPNQLLSALLREAVTRYLGALDHTAGECDEENRSDHSALQVG
jgi:hypothetical protein